MSDPCIVVVSYGQDLYDHDSDVRRDLIYNTWEGEENRSRRDNIVHYTNMIQKGQLSWIKAWELNVETGNTKLWLDLKNPVKTRLELNLPAKEAKQAMVKRVYKTPPSTASINQMLNSLDATSSFFTNPPLSTNWVSTTISSSEPTEQGS